MGVYEDFSPVFGELDAKQRKEIGQFAAELTKAACSDNVDQVADLMKQAASEITNAEDLEALLGVFEYIEKVAAPGFLGGIGSRATQNLPAALFALGTAFSAAPIAGMGAKWAARSRKINKSYDQIKREHPELRDDPYLDRYFDVLRTFSPDIASNPLIAGNVLRELHRLGPEALTPTKVKDLLALQRDYKGYKSDWHQPATALGTTAIKAATSEPVSSLASQVDTGAVNALP